ncbi:MAG: glycosyltransferase [Intestinibacillus sp.]
MKPVVIIPAYDPDETLIALAESLSRTDLPVLVIDDGSAARCRHIFDTLQNEALCVVIRHDRNRGKGAALRTGMRYAAAYYPGSPGYVTADADGQHAPKDILCVARALEQHPDSLILGTRDFRQKDVPFKSFWGNRITSAVYFLSTGRRCADTQTGLRGIPRRFYDLCQATPGERYEYEMNLLLAMGRERIPFITVPIATIYIEHNRASHFHPVRDSLRVYRSILKYSLSSLASAAADLSFFTLLVAAVGRSAFGLMVATIAARLLSGALNFTLNKFWVFRSSRQPSAEAAKYGVLFGSQMLTSWLLVAALVNFTPHITLAKIFVDTSLFFISYQVQKHVVFNRRKEKGLKNR